jgi:hypothetical protein
MGFCVSECSFEINVAPLRNDAPCEAWDVAHLWASIYLQTGIFPRGLADRFCETFFIYFGIEADYDMYTSL